MDWISSNFFINPFEFVYYLDEKLYFGGLGMKSLRYCKVEVVSIFLQNVLFCIKMDLDRKTEGIEGFARP
jgi:hypothetical protein